MDDKTTEKQAENGEISDVRIQPKNDSLDEAFKLTFEAIDKSNLERAAKRDLAYSCLIWQCIYYDTFDVPPHPILEKYGCFTQPEAARLELYDFIDHVLTLNTADIELKGAWCVNFMYLIMFGATADESQYEKLCAALHTLETFEAALNNKYSMFIPVSAEEMEHQNIPAPVINFMIPYLNYLNDDNGDGISNLTAFLRKRLAADDNEQVFARTELLLDTCPHDEEYMILNVASRAGLFKQRDKYGELIESSLPVIEEYIALDTARKVYFMYYRGLNLLALMRADEAKNQFAECLRLDNKFMLAELMLKALSARG